MGFSFDPTTGRILTDSAPVADSMTTLGDADPDPANPHLTDNQKVLLRYGAYGAAPLLSAFVVTSLSKAMAQATGRQVHFNICVFFYFFLSGWLPPDSPARVRAIGWYLC